MSKKKLLAVLTGMVMAFMGLAGVGAASAVDQQPEKASLTVHKYLGATTNLKHDGTAIEAGQLPKAPLAGVNFKLYQVEGVDVSTNDGLKLAQEISEKPITVNEGKAQITVNSKTYIIKPAKPASAVTGTDGTAKFENQDRGLYVVVEDLEGSGTITAAGKEVKKEKITPIAPFAVTLPMTDPEGTAWNADVHVYPKNQENTLDKRVEDAGVTTEGQGAKTPKDHFKYILTTKSTGADLNGDGKMDHLDLGDLYQIVDPLNSNLSLVSAEVKLGGVVATADTDYTLDKPTKENDNTVTINFEEPGLNKIAAGTDIEVVLNVKLNSVPEGGITPNQAKLYPNKWSKDNKKPITSPKVETKHGDIVIKKVNKDGGALKGAVFTVHLADAATKSCSDLTKLGPAIKTSEATDDKGLASFKDLQLTNFIDGKEVAEKDQVPYCLVEKTAPKGYQLLPQAIEFSLTTPGTVTDLTQSTDGDGHFVQITNHKNPGLPLTGAQGILLVSVLGLILVSVGVVLTVKRRQD